MADKVPTPKPVTIEQECSLCGEDWEAHPNNPTALDCIALLRSRPKEIQVTVPCYRQHYPQWTYTSPYTISYSNIS